MRLLIFKLLFFFFLISPLFSLGQKIELINSADVINQGIKLCDSGKYKNGIVLYNKVSRSDTNYVWSLYQKATACEADSQYNDALKYCREGLALKEQREYEPELYNVYGNTLLDLKSYDKALNVFDEAIKKYPAYSLLYFNRGIVLMELKKDAEAEAWFKKTLLINPYMYSAHYQLGLAALRQGKVIPAYLSIIGYLLVNPEGRYFSNSIKLLNEITQGADEVLAFKNARKNSPDANYQAVEDIVFSKIALDKAYKPIISMDDPISRQIQAVFEKLEYKNDDPDFWIQYYLPFYRKVYQEGKFEEFVFRVFSNVNIPAVQAYNKRNKKQLSALTEEAGVYFDNIRATRQLMLASRDTVKLRYQFSGDRLYGKGTIINGKTVTGKWRGLYSAGNIKSTGMYSETGERTGDWLWYKFTGDIGAKEHYVNGKLDGTQYYYFSNGNLSSKEIYSNGELNGVSTGYYLGGNVKVITNYKVGKKDGEEKKFYSNGVLSDINNYANGLLSGTEREYYKNGKLKHVTEYANGKPNGVEKTYHENGALSIEGQNVNDKSEGVWKYYYESGKLKQKTSFVNNVEDGLHESYYENGTVETAYTNQKGKINGDAINYTRDGKILSKYTYNNGNIVTVKYYDKVGHELSTASLKNGLVDILAYDRDGHKGAHFFYNPKGLLTGPDTIFFPSGKIHQINNYKDNELNGPSVTYYLNGKKKYEVNMKDGKGNGYYTGYYVNGRIQSEGWTREGESQGEWHFYDELGKLTTRSNYLDDDFHGYKEEYYPDGKKAREYKYYRGWLEKITHYDNEGKVAAVDSFPKACGKFTLRYPNGHIKAETYYKNGDFDGVYKTCFFDGSAESVFFYKGGLLDSTYTSYYYGGVKNWEGHYAGGKKKGLWKYYDENGKLNNASEYDQDMLNGTKTFYFPDGTKDYTAICKDDQLQGKVNKFDPSGSLAYQINYEDDVARSFSYQGSDGKLVPEVPIAAINGVIKAYFQNGKVSRECGYSDGWKHGSDIIYYSNGQIRSIDTLAYNINEGISKEFYASGQLKSSYNYVDDNLQGVGREYNSNGTLKKEIAYENGLSHGPAKYYDDNGKLLKTMFYYYGNLINVKNEK
jgi:antitoxin component YwqK of YwqJK toxin-antitoxin module/Tfp pilus assembly protein PilF